MQSKSDMLNLVLFIQPLGLKPNMLWINGQRSAGVPQTGAAERVLVNFITHTNYCLGETNSWAWTPNVTPLKVTRFKGLCVFDSKFNWSVQHGKFRDVLVFSNFKKGGRIDDKLWNLFLSVRNVRNYPAECCFYSLSLVKFENTFWLMGNH